MDSSRRAEAALPGAERDDELCAAAPRVAGGDPQARERAADEPPGGHVQTHRHRPRLQEERLSGDAALEADPQMSLLRQ